MLPLPAAAKLGRRGVLQLQALRWPAQHPAAAASIHNAPGLLPPGSTGASSSCPTLPATGGARSFAGSARRFTAPAESLEFEEATVSPVETGTFRAADLVTQRTADPAPKTPLEDLKFGWTFTDHMLVVDWARGGGWSHPKVRPTGPLKVHPGAQVFHYGMGCFEGMKAYHGADGKGRLFRPDLNLARLQRSCARQRLPGFKEYELLGCIKSLLRTDRSWLPERDGYSLYLRPVAYATTAHLGVGAPQDSTLCVLLSPVGPYFKEGMRAINVHLDEVHVRAWPGGAGSAKVAGNYAPTILPGVAAKELHDADMVLYALPHSSGDPEMATVSECGAMNVFFLMEKKGGRRELVTAPLDGTILPGVTRDSVLALARGWGEMDVSERPVTVGELARASEEGRLLEAFGTGTAAIVQPIARVGRAAGGGIAPAAFDPADPATMCARLTTAIADIQYGRVEHPWSVPFE